MATLAEIRDGYNRINTRLIRGAGDLASNLFSNLGSWRDDDVERYQRLIRPQIDGIKLQAAQLQAAYYQEVAKQQGKPYEPAAVRPDDLTETNLRNGAEVTEVYRRPFVSMYTELAKGELVGAAIAVGAARAASIASTDIQLAARIAGLKQRQNNDNIVGYRRVLTGSENCALCAIASTQRYTRNELKPIHPGCDCTEEPIYGDFDPGQVIDPQGLETIHQALQRQLGVSDVGARNAGIGKATAAGEPISDFTEIIVTREHGEYGPTLAWRDQKFTGPSDL